MTNTVELRYIAPNRSAEPAILDHFGHPDWLSVHWEGPPPWTGPWGRLVVRVVDSAGRPLPAEANPHCTPTPIESSVRYDPGVATGTDATGTCIFDRIPAAAFDIEVSFTDSHDTTKTVHRQVVVPADGTGNVTIEVER